MKLTKIKIGDVVELLPTNQRNRQLRRQEGKKEWRVIDFKHHVQALGKEGFAIESVIDSSHWRWVSIEDIELIKFRENERREDE